MIPSSTPREDSSIGLPRTYGQDGLTEMASPNEQNVALGDAPREHAPRDVRRRAALDECYRAVAEARAKFKTSTQAPE